MFWHMFLFILFIVFIVVGIISFAIGVIGGDEITLVICFICLIFAPLSILGANKIESNNTSITTEIIRMEITRCEMTSVKSSNVNGYTNHYFVTLEEKHIVEVSHDIYSSLKEGDVVCVEIIYTTKFGEELSPKYRLKM